MKNLINIIFTLIIALGISSCGDNFLDVTPKNSLSEPTFWSSPEDVQRGLAGTYHYWESYMNIIFLDAMSDNGYQQYDYGYAQKINGDVTPSNIIQGSGFVDNQGCNWFTYSRVRKYNKFLERIEAISMDADIKARYKAEVRFLRAYDYFNKVMFFGGVPLVTEVVPPDVQKSRTPAADIKQFILDELNDISSKLPIQNEIESQGHITRGAVLALKARLELYIGEYEKAMTDSKAVIDMGVYELYPDYRGLFLPENESSNNEAILTIQYIENDYPNDIPQLLQPNGYSALSATKSLVDTYETTNGKTIDEDPSYDPKHPFKNRDPRLGMTIIYPGQVWNGKYYNSLDQFIPDGNSGTMENGNWYRNSSGADGGLIPKKYVKLTKGEEDQQNYGANIMVIRLAEMYLTYAEAAIETGQNTDLGLQYINKIRTRAGMPEAKDLTEKLVRRERRVELAFEGLRYFDIKRWDLGPEVIQGSLYGSREGSVNMQTGEVTYSNSNEYIKIEERLFIPERNYLLPIPLDELDTNPKITQNPGY